MQLRTMLEWDIAPSCERYPAFTEINTHGGSYKTFEVRPDPDLLASNHLTLADVFRRLAENNGSAGGGYVVHHDEQRFIRGEALFARLQRYSQCDSATHRSGIPRQGRGCCRSRDCTDDATGRCDAGRPRRSRDRTGDDADRRELAPRRGPCQAADRANTRHAAGGRQPGNHLRSLVPHFDARCTQ